AGSVVSRCMLVFFFSSRRRHTRSKRDWSSDVCSSDLRYGATGMSIYYPDSTLQGQKSWFMFDDEVVALGAGITSDDDRSIETVRSEERRVGKEWRAGRAQDDDRPRATNGGRQTSTRPD